MDNSELVDYFKKEIELVKNLLFDERAERIALQAQFKNEIYHLRKENSELKQALDTQESKNRKNNIIIFGVDETSDQTCEETVTDICKSLNVDVGENGISEAFRVGRNRGTRPIVCKVANFNKKCEIMRKNKQCGNFKILHDLTKKERRDRKELQHHINIARGKGKRAFVRHGNLVVDGFIFTKEQLSDTPSHNNTTTAGNEAECNKMEKLTTLQFHPVQTKLPSPNVSRHSGDGGPAVEEATPSLEFVTSRARPWALRSTASNVRPAAAAKSPPPRPPADKNVVQRDIRTKVKRAPTTHSHVVQAKKK